METATDYKKLAEDFLSKGGIDFSFTLIGDDCPMSCEDARAQRDMGKVNAYPRKTHIHGKHYRCTFTRKGIDPQVDRFKAGTFVIEFWNSYADEEENFFAFGSGGGLDNWVTGRENCYWDKYRHGGKYPGSPRAKKRIAPTAYDVLACVQKNDPGTFHDFCGDFGYDEDSRRAESVYQAVQQEYRNVVAFFTAEEMPELEQIS